MAMHFILRQVQYLLEVPGLKFVSKERRDPSAGGGLPALPPFPAFPAPREKQYQS